MQDKILNIVAFDNPYPPNYGGVIDVYYKIKALYEIGFDIHLHCFVKEVPKECIELQLITASVNFYKTEVKWYHLFSSLPISVISRAQKELVDNLVKIDAPILFEGLKTTCLYNDVRLKAKSKYLRYHNIEHNYYKGLALSETNLVKKFLFWIESNRYKKYENTVLGGFKSVLTLSNADDYHVNTIFGNSVLVPVFHGNSSVDECLSEFGEFTLFHGDLKTSDNLKSAFFVIEIFKKIKNRKLVIASSSGKEIITKKIEHLQNIQFIELQTNEQLKELFTNAHICISWSFQKSGTKLKLINTLFQSRHNVINQNITDSQEVIGLCHIVASSSELVETINRLMEMPYAQKELIRRKKVLIEKLNDFQNAKKLVEVID
ncbi:hypothetical protein ACFS5J_12530 [Flavobacterium chuncheonense]|uniref:Glycosyltransferase n=2 Tax=Flavobacterium chuncheonense TaxID=2026653 RepID=A0ABW5YP94_9FLAO